MGSLEKVRKKYDRYSRVYDAFEYITERLWFAKWRKILLQDLNGWVLEIGVGTGKNLQHYPQNARVIGVDLSGGMLAKARKRLRGLPTKAWLVMANGERLPFKSNAFQTIVLTYVLCSIPRPVKSLREAARVLVPPGEIRMLEHVLSKNRIIALFEKIHSPLTRWLFGFNLNRDTPENIRRSGVQIVREENLAVKDVFKKIIAKKP
jgi:demethylmenaquinone methyltransferase/2-methoxy-6-polyprenyl-1,4-benzoquinol methylase